MTIEEIRKLKDYYVDELYRHTRTEQRNDDQYYNDTFPVELIKNPLRISRTGRGARHIDEPVEQIVSGILKASRRGNEEKANRISRMLNDWIKTIMKQNPNILKEFVKNQFLRGEAWIYPVHNEAWVTGAKIKSGLPVIFLAPDPMTIYASPNENENGIPENVIVYCQRKVSIIQAKYPNWVTKKERDDNVDWLGFYDKDIRYFEADKQPVLGPQKNIYGLVPFIHKIAGFGKTSPEGKMEDLIVGKLRHLRNRLLRECIVTSDIDTGIHLFVNKGGTVQGDDEHPVPDDFAEAWEKGPNIINELPPGIKYTPTVEDLPTAEVFAYLNTIRGELGAEMPLSMSGVPVGASGRLQDISYMTAMRKYAGIVKNTENAFATAFSMGLRMIEIPGLYPDDLEAGDIDKYYEVEIQLKADDPIADDRLRTLGSRLYQQGEIDLRTNLIDYQGKTQEEAEDIITNILVDKVTLQSPDVAEIMGRVFAEEAGMTKYLEEARARRAGLEAQQKGLQEATPPTEATRRGGEVGTPLGREMIDEALRERGARRSPTPYTRGG